MADLLTLLGDQGIPTGFLLVATWFGRALLGVAHQLADRMAAAFEVSISAAHAHTGAVRDLAEAVELHAGVERITLPENNGRPSDRRSGGGS